MWIVSVENLSIRNTGLVKFSDCGYLVVEPLGLLGHQAIWEPGNKDSLILRDAGMSVNEEVFSKVQSALVDAVGVDEGDVTPGATMVGDLGAESIDFLDIVFKLEKAFGIKIQTEDLFPKDILTQSNFVQDGKVNSNGLSELKKRMPWADLTKFESNPRVQDFGDLLTVSDLCRYVQTKLA